MSNSLQPHGLYGPWNSLGKNTGVSSRSLLQGIFPIQGRNSGFLHCGQILFQLNHKGIPRILEWVALPLSRGSSKPRDQTQVFHNAGGLFSSLSRLLSIQHTWRNPVSTWRNLSPISLMSFQRQSTLPSCMAPRLLR